MRFGIALLFLPWALAANTPTFTFPLTNAGINAITTDSAGNTYLTGTTTGGASIVTTPGAFQPQFTATGNDSFVVKIDPTGAVVFATYLGGNGSTSAYAIAVDQQGNVYVAGVTSPPIGGTGGFFPVTPGAAFTNPGTAIPGFIAKLNASGTQLVYATFIPYASVSALAVDLEGNAYITGYGSAFSFPTTAGAFQVAPKGSSNFSPGIVAKLNAAGSALVYASYLSGSGGPPDEGDNPSSIAVDAAGNAFIAGWTYSTDFPVTPGAFLTTSPGVRNIFLTKLNPQGSGLAYSTYLGSGGGGAPSSDPVTVKLDAQGTAFIAGASVASFPTTPGTLTGSSASGSFLTHVSANGSSLLYSTYLPAGLFLAAALDVDSAGNAVVACTAPSFQTLIPGAPNFTILSTGVGAFQQQYAGGDSDVYIARFTPDGQVSGSTYLGGSQIDSAQAIALAPNGSVVVAGQTTSPDFPGLAQSITSQGVNFVTNIFVSLTVENAASYVATAVAPGEIVALRGYGIGPATGVSANPTTQLADVQVSFGGFDAPLFYAQSGQVNAQVPWELFGQTLAAVQVTYPGLASTPTPIVVTPAVPGIFFVNNSGGTRNSPSNPARAGDYIAIYGTGGGTLNSPGMTGQTWGLAPLSNLTLAASVFVGGQNATVLYAGSAPGLESGIFQINAVLPAGLAATSLYVTIGNASSAPVSISVAAQ